MCAARSPARWKPKPGLFEAAQGGTLFLDEVARVAADAYRRSCCERSSSVRVQRVGSLQPKRVDVAVIAATNRDLRSEVACRPFSRRPVLPTERRRALTLPPLRDRREDIPYLTGGDHARVRERHAEDR